MSWYERYKGGTRLPDEVRSFLDQYTESEFRADFETLYPEIMVGPMPADILLAASSLMRRADAEPLV